MTTDLELARHFAELTSLKGWVRSIDQRLHRLELRVALIASASAGVGAFLGRYLG